MNNLQYIQKIEEFKKNNLDKYNLLTSIILENYKNFYTYNSSSINLVHPDFLFKEFENNLYQIFLIPLFSKRTDFLNSLIKNYEKEIILIFSNYNQKQDDLHNTILFNILNLELEDNNKFYIKILEDQINNVDIKYKNNLDKSFFSGNLFKKRLSDNYYKIFFSDIILNKILDNLDLNEFNHKKTIENILWDNILNKNYDKFPLPSKTINKLIEKTNNLSESNNILNYCLDNHIILNNDNFLKLLTNLNNKDILSYIKIFDNLDFLKINIKNIEKIIIENFESLLNINKLNEINDSNYTKITMKLIENKNIEKIVLNYIEKQKDNNLINYLKFFNNKNIFNKIIEKINLQENDNIQKLIPYLNNVNDYVNFTKNEFLILIDCLEKTNDYNKLSMFVFTEKNKHKIEIEELKEEYIKNNFLKFLSNQNCMHYNYYFKIYFLEKLEKIFLNKEEIIEKDLLDLIKKNSDIENICLNLLEELIKENKPINTYSLKLFMDNIENNHKNKGKLLKLKTRNKKNKFLNLIKQVFFINNNEKIEIPVKNKNNKTTTTTNNTDTDNITNDNIINKILFLSEELSLTFNKDALIKIKKIMPLENKENEKIIIYEQLCENTLKSLEIFSVITKNNKDKDFSELADLKKNIEEMLNFLNKKSNVFLSENTQELKTNIEILLKTNKSIGNNL